MVCKGRIQVRCVEVFNSSNVTLGSLLFVELIFLLNVFKEFGKIIHLTKKICFHQNSCHISRVASTTDSVLSADV